MCTDHAASLLCIVTRLLISLLLHNRWEGSGWYIRALSTRILVIFNDGNNNKAGAAIIVRLLVLPLGQNTTMTVMNGHIYKVWGYI